MNNKEEKPQIKFNKSTWSSVLKIMKYMKPYRWYFLFGMVCLSLSSVLFMLFPAAAGEMANTAAGKSKYNFTINQYGLFFIILLVAQGILSYARSIALAVVSEKGISQVRQDLYAAMITQPVAFFESNKEKAMLEFSTGASHDEVAHLVLPELDAVIVYPAGPWVNAISQVFPNARIFPSAYLFAKYAWSQGERNIYSMYLYRIHGFLLLAVMEGKKLLLLNHYSVQNDEDILYHASNAAMRLNMDFENLMVMCFDHDDEKHSISLLRQYNHTASCGDFGVEAKPGIKPSFITHLHILCA